MNKVESKFKNKAIIRPGGMMLFAKIDAIDFINECKEASIIILGVDAFYMLPENKIQPSMEHSANYSTLNPKEQTASYEEIIEFLKKQPDNLFFEISNGEA